MLRWPANLDIVLHQDAVVNYRGTRWASQFSAGIKTWGVKNDIVGLPLSWWP